LGVVVPVSYVLYHATIKKDSSRYLTVDERDRCAPRRA
jgi:hypothetical protein